MYCRGFRPYTHRTKITVGRCLFFFLFRELVTVSRPFVLVRYGAASKVVALHAVNTDDDYRYVIKQHE